ncbi:hypothetical protein CDAR_275181 [Caerostris darwini]|uniref:Uncharacterized protein n=1 Tax=Caerostris darwini TaxID=1538125 RepID=A0AAV4VZ61_9ARAC|nr:hypothetical protein CDAR_275181 [Caerostris darwini]
MSSPVKPRLSGMNGHPGISRPFRVLQRKKTPLPEVVLIREKRDELCVSSEVGEGTQKEKGTERRSLILDGDGGPLSSLTGKTSRVEHR